MTPRTARPLTAGAVLAAAALVVLAAPAAAAPGVAASTAPTAASAGISAAAAYKQRTDTDPHVAIPAAAAAKPLRRSARTNWGPGTGDYALRPNQQGQITGYYCGPAAVSEALDLRGVGLSQSQAAGKLRTDGNGTAWSGVNANVGTTTGYPVPDVLNAYTNAGYVPVAVPYTPSGGDVGSFKSRLVSNVDTGYPLVGDGWEVPGGPHLAGHPNVEIFHWFTIRGYSSWGDQTQYEDSATTVWGTVPPYQTMSTATIVTILGGRGYVW